ncbi:MAG: TolC family protein, partial [Verrucomicrobiota bacterium]
MSTQSLTRTALRLAALALSLLLTACATAPSSTKRATAAVTKPLPSTAPADTDAAALALWWERFDDPVLNQLITTALADSPDIRTAASRIAESRAVRGTTKAGLFPTLSAGVSGSGNRTRDRATDTTTTSESYGASLDASWEIDLFGQQRKTLAAADADLAQTRENYHAA